PQAALGLAAVLVGAALAAALLNLHDGVRRKMTQEFRAYGANAIVSPRGDASGPSRSSLVGDDILTGLAEWRDHTPGAALAPLLHVVMRLRPSHIDERLPEFQNVVVVGTDFQAIRALYPNWRLGPEGVQSAVSPQKGECVVGTRVASQLRLAAGSEISVEPAEAAEGTATALQCRISGILSAGAAEDDQVFVPLAALQQATALEGRQSVVELLIPGEAADVERTVAELGGRFPSISVRPVRAIVESQGRVLGTIRWLLVTLTALIVAIVALCVMATMTAIVLERKKDVAIMKALGATDRLIMRLFLCEGAGLGLVGGVAGFGLGIILARELGLKLFGVTLDPTWWTLPLIGFGSVGIAVLATAFPVRMARSVRPATTLKGV
ncbi:MAG: ABC transporter permease, partial [Acidobacteria bacterium]|nr:ABC transporter permease [Acidobacteriota bacterium]